MHQMGLGRLIPQVFGSRARQEMSSWACQMMLRAHDVPGMFGEGHSGCYRKGCFGLFLMFCLPFGDVGYLFNSPSPAEGLQERGCISLLINSWPVKGCRLGLFAVFEI